MIFLTFIFRTGKNLKPIIFLCILAVFMGCKSGFSQEPKDSDEQNTWVLDSFEDFMGGTFDDSGVNTYVAADGSLRLVNQWDLTGDGYLDIFLPNTHGENERTELFLYYGGDNWDPQQRIELPSDGGQDVAVADLNNDGKPDLVLANRFNGTKSELDLWIYWGDKGGFSADNRTSLPTYGAEAVAVGDLNGDGYSEIVIANSGLSYHVAVDSFRKSFIYWNSKGTFSPDNRLELPTNHARDVLLIDYNQDDNLDIIFANEGSKVGEGGLTVFKNSAEKNRIFSADDRIFLPGESSSAVAAEDLNKDGQIDLVVANAFRLEGREGGIYNMIETTYLNSFIYWGGEKGFRPNRRTELPTINPQDISIGDFDNDGWADIFFAQSGGDVNFLYKGGANGFFPNRRKSIPAANDGSAEFADLNSDGWNDLVVAPSASPDSSESKARVYWGDSKGVVFDDPLLIPVGNTGGLAVADLDGDTTMDLVFANRSEGPAASRSPGYLYSGGPKGFSVKSRVELPAVLADSYLSSDFNADGYVDLFVPQVNPTIYWGALDGFDEENTAKISDQFAVSGRSADFNRDGFLDLVLSEWSAGREKTHVYYGSPSGFTAAYKEALPIRSVRFHSIADLNNDGWVDILFPNFIGEEIVIFWNTPLGFNPNDKTVLPVRSAVSVEVADLNADGFLDVIVPNLFDKNPGPDKKRSFGGSPESDTFIFWGGPDGPKEEDLTVLPTIGAEDVAVADINKNGKLDLVVTSYHAGETRSHPSYIFWNKGEGYDPMNSTMIPTNSASGALVADFNRDEWPDIFFANHSKDGNHRNDSWLYYGGVDGFSEDRRTSLPGIGPHMLTVVDIGHIFDRSDSYSYISEELNAGKNVQVQNLTWDANTPFDTQVRFQIRAATTKEGLKDATWSGATGTDSYFTDSDEEIANDIRGSWFQIRAELISPNGANSPIIRKISLNYF